MGGKSSKGAEEITKEKDEKIANGKTEIDDKKKVEDDKPPPPPPVPYLALYRYASTGSKISAFVALIAAVITGASLPGMIILFGNVSNALVGSGTDPGHICPPNSTLSGLTRQVVDVPNGTGTSIRQNPGDEAPAPPLDDFLNQIETFAIGLSALGAATLLLSWIFVTLFNRISENIVFELRHRYLEALLRQNVGWYDTVQDKNFVSRISEDLVKVQEATGEKVGLCAFFMATTVASLGVAFYYGWKLTLVILASAPVLAIANGVVGVIQSRLSGDEQSSYAKAGNVAEEALTNVRTVMAFSGLDKELKRYEDGLQIARDSARKRSAISAFGVGLMWVIIYASYALAFWYGTKLILEGREDYCQGKEPEYDAGNLLIVFFSVLTGAFQIGQSAQYFEAFACGRGSAAVIYSVIDRVPEIDSYSEAGKKPAQRSKGAITFKDIWFNYPSRPDVPIMKGFNLTIRPGKTIALVGHSGCGKSTSLQLLQRFYDPLKGEVLVDGENIKDLHLGWLRSQIGVVSQEPILFNTTILENIQYGREGVSLKEAEEACRQANAHGFISKLPSGYNTIVGDRGAQLSGGQKQRIAIARALVRNPAILLLDEATSALDTQSESVVQAALDRARLGRTTLIVAHRLSTIRTADLVVAINEGKVAEMGTHKELLALKGLYHGLVMAQIQGRGETMDDEEDEDEEAASEKQRQLEKTLAENNRKSFTALDDDEVGPVSTAVAEALMDEKDLAKEAPITRLMKLNQPEWKIIVVGIISAIIQGGLLPLYAVLFGEYMKVLSLPDDEARSEANQLAIWFVVLGLGAGITMFLEMFLLALAGEALTSRLRKMTFKAMLQQEVGWYDDPNNTIGALCSRLAGDAAHVQGATGSRVGTVVQCLATISIACFLALYYELKLGAVTMVFVPFVIAATYFQMKLMMGNDLGEKKAIDEASKVAVQAVGNIRTVASLVKERFFVKMYNENLIRPHKKVLKMAHLRGLVFGFAQSVPYFAYAVVMYYGGKLVENEGLAFDKVFKVAEALIFGTMMVGQTLAFSPNYNKAKVSGARILRLLDRKPAIDSSRGVGLQINNGVGSILFDKVAFSYPTRPDARILRDLSCGIEPGKSVALVGPSGCGKSTCIQLILRYYDPLSGTVKFDEQDVSALNIDSLRSQMAIVAQEPALFDRTIAQNIAYGDNSREVPMDEVISAAKQANIHNFIASLPAGYETRVGEMGTQLSGGQKQRVAIARALVRKPKLILLDEATSALDTESEKVVQEALDAAAEGRTSISIAHRLSSIQNVDRIIVINQGEVYESGSHAELLEKKGLYFRLWNMQGQHSSNSNH